MAPEESVQLSVPLPVKEGTDWSGNLLREPDPGRPGQPGPRGRRRPVPAQKAAGGS